MFYSPDESRNKKEYLMIFAHGNGCDIGTMHYTLSEFSRHLKIYIISFEYPSYGLCKGTSPSQHTINEHADRTYDFVRQILEWPAERIIIYGHSIGTGAACYLASTRVINAMILQSPYTSISTLVHEKVGKLSWLVGRRSWDNLEAMKNIMQPVLFIHGLDDNLIPSHHSQILYDACLNQEQSKLVLLRQENHNSMSETTLLRYISPFLERNLVLIKRDALSSQIEFPLEYRQMSANVDSRPAVASSRSSILSSLRSMSRASTVATASTVRTLLDKKGDVPDQV
jgi:pimeloyl-ACP methyl ester carboxylesterase